MAADLAYFFRWQPSEVGRLTMADLEWWTKQAERIAERNQR